MSEHESRPEQPAGKPDGPRYGRNPQRTPEEVNASGKDWYTLFTVFSRAGSSIKRVNPAGGLPLAGGNRIARTVTDFFNDAETTAEEFDTAAH